MPQTIRWIIIAFLIYVGTYVVFRHFNTEVWARDSRTYVIFPQGYGTALYYLWRPLTYVDGAATKMQFHIGPHR